MCLSIPAKILEINGEIAKAEISGNIIEVGLQLVEDVKINDYVLVHTGYALQIIDKKEAEETIRIIKNLNAH